MSAEDLLLFYLQLITCVELLHIKKFEIKSIVRITLIRDQGSMSD